MSADVRVLADVHELAAGVVAAPAYTDAGSGGRGVRLAASIAADLPRVTGSRGWAIPDGFTAKPGQWTVISAGDTGPTVGALGLGDAAPSQSRLRIAAAVYGAATRHADGAAILVPAECRTPDAVGAIVEGFVYGRYRYRPDYVPVGDDDAVRLHLVAAPGADLDALRHAASRALVAADAVAWVRWLVDTPPSRLYPEELARQIQSRAAPAGVTCRTWSAAQAERAGFGGTVAVGGGSARPPAVVHLTYAPDGAAPMLGLAGKGITFDSGGINLKRDPDEISWMKSDMAAAAAVAAAVCAAATLGGARSIHAVLPLAESLPGRGSLLPGDVVTHPDGSRTEVLDTDNEGRLVLADAIAYLRTAVRPDAIVDVGTLTDGGGVGHLYWGCWGTSARLVADLVAAGDAVGDAGWHLPLRDDYRELLESTVADRANRARDVPDTGLIAATFLSEFPGEIPWAHIDNGSTAYLDADLPPWSHGPTGSPARALLQYLTTRPVTYGDAAPS